MSEQLERRRSHRRKNGTRIDRATVDEVVPFSVIAERIGAQESSVQRTYHNAMKKLRKALR